MLAVLASAVDVLHALFMVLWVVGLPLLFWHRWPRATVAYGVYALVFAAVNQGSHLLLGECFLTTIARAVWQRSGAATPAHADEWFTVRLAERVFALTPSHQGVKLVTEALIVIIAIGTLYSMHGLRGARRQAGATMRPSRDLTKHERAWALTAREARLAK